MGIDWQEEKKRQNRIGAALRMMKERKDKPTPFDYLLEKCTWMDIAHMVANEWISRIGDSGTDYILTDEGAKHA